MDPALLLEPGHLCLGPAGLPQGSRHMCRKQMAERHVQAAIAARSHTAWHCAMQLGQMTAVSLSRFNLAWGCLTSSADGQRLWHNPAFDRSRRAAPCQLAHGQQAPCSRSQGRPPGPADS